MAKDDINLQQNAPPLPDLVAAEPPPAVDGGGDMDMAAGGAGAGGVVGGGGVGGGPAAVVNPLLLQQQLVQLLFPCSYRLSKIFCFTGPSSSSSSTWFCVSF